MSDDSSTTSAATGSSFKFDAKRWSKVDRNTAVATLVFLVCLFLPWFGVQYSGYGGNVDGLWHGYMYLALLISLATVLYLVLRAGLDTLPFKMPLSHTKTLLLTTGVTFLLALISFLTKPSGTSWQFGAYIGLVAATIAAAPFAISAVRARRAETS